jgi:hypothetical protein
VLIDRKNLGKHRPWIVFAILSTIAASVWYFAASRYSSQWPGGSSPPGFTFGVLGGLLCLFEFAIWPRKKLFRAWRIGRTQTWMLAHIWLGLLAVPLLIYHSGFRWGGALSAVLMGLFLIVIISGVYGLALQQFIPSRLLNQVPAETIHSQIGRIVLFLHDDAARIVAATCGLAPGEEENAEDAKIEQGAPISHLTVGAVQTVGDVQGMVLTTKVPKNAVVGAEPLREVFRTSIKQYLLEGRRSGSPLALPNKSAAIFRELRVKLPHGTSEAIDILENLCDQRRQLDRQERLHTWLHNWLCVHLPLSVALIVLMFVHIWVALKYR